jgi:hypothetical protein
LTASLGALAAILRLPDGPSRAELKDAAGVCNSLRQKAGGIQCR